MKHNARSRATAIAGLILLSPALLRAQELDIRPNQRVGNPDGRCFGSALEDCARYMGFRSLYRVSGEFRGGAIFWWSGEGNRRHVERCMIDDVLKRRGWTKGRDWDEVFFSRDVRWLEDRVNAGYPVVVSIGPDHGMCLRKLTATEAVCVDNDGMRTPHGFYWANSDRRMSRRQFVREWEVLGWAICLYHEPEELRYGVRRSPYRLPPERGYPP